MSQHGDSGKSIDRRTLLCGAVATATAASLGRRSLAREAGTGAVQEPPVPALSPFDLDFSIIEQVRPFDLLPRGSMQVREWFDGGAVEPYDGAGLQADGHSAKISPAGAAARLTSAAASPTLFRADAGPVAPYAAVIVALAATASGGGGEAAVLAGLVRDPHNYVVASFDAGDDAANGIVSIDLVVDGRRTRAASARADLTGPARLAFVLNETYVTALVGDVASWTPVVQHRVMDLLDLRDPAVLGAHRYGFGIGGVGASADIAGFEAGYFGQAGLRDPHVVSTSNGTPYVRGNKLYFTATQAGLSFFQAAHWGVWTLDLDDLSRIDPVASLFFARDGLVLGDHAGQIVVDERDGGFHVAVSSWGDFAFKGVHVRYVRTFEDILSGVHVLESQPLRLPTDASAWDPAMVRIDDRWYVGFVESPLQDPVRGFRFHPALARGGIGGPVTDLHKVGADLTRLQTEGTVLQKIGGRWYLMASDGEDRKYRVYDLAMRALGVLHAPYGTNIPHPQIVPIGDRGRTSYLLLTFNGTQFGQRVLGYGTHGDFIVMRARQTAAGDEFAP